MCIISRSIYLSLSVHTCIYIYIYISLSLYIYIYTLWYICVYIYIYIYTYIHIHTHLLLFCLLFFFSFCFVFFFVYFLIHIWHILYTHTYVDDAHARPRQQEGREHGGALQVVLVIIMPNLPTNIVDFRRFDSSIILSLMGGIPRSIGDFPESLSQAILVGTMLVGRLCVLPLLSSLSLLSLLSLLFLLLLLSLLWLLWLNKYLHFSIMAGRRACAGKRVGCRNDWPVGCLPEATCWLADGCFAGLRGWLVGNMAGLCRWPLLFFISCVSFWYFQSFSCFSLQLCVLSVSAYFLCYFLNSVFSMTFLQVVLLRYLHLYVFFS